VPSAVLDGISTRYEVIGDGPPILMYAPGGFDATIEKWRTQSVYARIKLFDTSAEEIHAASSSTAANAGSPAAASRR
jgi:hypothetical protein